MPEQSNAWYRRQPVQGYFDTLPKTVQEQMIQSGNSYHDVISLEYAVTAMLAKNNEYNK